MNPKWNESWFSFKRYQTQEGTVLAEMSMHNSIWSLRLDGQQGSWSNLDPKALMDYAERKTAWNKLSDLALVERAD